MICLNLDAIFLKYIQFFAMQVNKKDVSYSLRYSYWFGKLFGCKNRPSIAQDPPISIAQQPSADRVTGARTSEGRSERYRREKGLLVQWSSSDFSSQLYLGHFVSTISWDISSPLYHGTFRPHYILDISSPLHLGYLLTTISWDILSPLYLGYLVTTMSWKFSPHYILEISSPLYFGHLVTTISWTFSHHYILDI